MVDPLEVVIAWLGQDADLANLVGTRIAAKHRYGVSWTAGLAGLAVRLDGGLPDLYAAVQEIRLDVRCYASTQQLAVQVWRRLVELSRDRERVPVLAASGSGLLYRFLQASGPSLLYDTELKMDFVLCFFNALVSEDAL